MINMNFHNFNFDQVKWPCTGCGADDADVFKFKPNEKGEFEVYMCSNCGKAKKDEHVESPCCWCQPTLMYKPNKDGGTEHWVHNRLQ